MRARIPKILITGGAGFIGSAFVGLLVKKGYKVSVIDKLSYAGDLERLQEVKGKYKFYKTDIYNKKQVEHIFKKESPRILVHFAAQTHVDRSILDSGAFIETNVIGTQVLLDVSRKYKIQRFIFISTDEIYGEIKKGKFSEDSPFRPSNPYAASKAAADLLIRSYVRTYNFPAIIIRPCNNYGPWQYPEKLIPLAILKILRNEKVPVYGEGRNVREWLYVEDCVAGILAILKEGRTGEAYNLGSGEERENLNVVKKILGILREKEDFIEFVKDRPGHDKRYNLDSRKVFRETGWRPKVSFEQGLRSTVNWCIDNEGWLLSKKKEVERLYK